LEEKPLELEEFYNEIDLREGFYQESIDDDPLLMLWQSAAKDTREQECLRAVFIETMDNNDKEPEQDDDLEELGDYNDNRHSDHAKKQEELINNIREFLTTQDSSQLGIINTEQAKFVQQASHYWLNKKDGKLYRKNAREGNPQLFIGIEDWM